MIFDVDEIDCGMEYFVWDVLGNGDCYVCDLIGIDIVIVGGEVVWSVSVGYFDVMFGEIFFGVEVVCDVG